MNAVEMQPTVLPSFPVSDTRPPLPANFSKHDPVQSHYIHSRHSSKENRTPSPLERQNYSPTSGNFSRSPAPPGAVHDGVQQSPPSIAAGKKRLANGDVKDGQGSARDSPKQVKSGHSRNTSTLSTTSNAAMLELSQQLRTRLTYAMVKVQNGWQNRSLDEVESLASASPRSTTFNHYSDIMTLLSPRAAMSAHADQAHSDTSSDSNPHDSTTRTRPDPILMSPPPSRRGLAPPANIVSRPSHSRRRPTPNMQINTGKNLSPSPARPAAAQRTASQNAVLEADAVETLLFMASPHNSGNPGGSGPQLSPVTSAPSVQHFPSQNSPLRNTLCGPTSPKRVAFSTDVNTEYCARYGRDKKAVIASLVERLDEDDNRELDEALMLMDRHHAAKIAAS